MISCSLLIVFATSEGSPINRLQEVVNKGLCLTYRDGQATYAITVGSKGHTTLKVGQTISRRIVDRDVVFLNKPHSTHKHSLQAFYVYVKSYDKILGKFQVCHLHSFDNTRLQNTRLQYST